MRGNYRHCAMEVQFEHHPVQSKCAFGTVAEILRR